MGVFFLRVYVGGRVYILTRTGSSGGVPGANSGIPGTAYLILRPLGLRALLGRSHESANDGLYPVEKRRRAERPSGSFVPTAQFLFPDLQILGTAAGPLPWRRGSLCLVMSSPKRVVLQRLLDSLLDLFGVQAGVGTRDLFSPFPHECHGVKCLLVLHVTPLAAFVSRSNHTLVQDSPR